MNAEEYAALCKTIANQQLAIEQLMILASNLIARIQGVEAIQRASAPTIERRVH